MSVQVSGPSREALYLCVHEHRDILGMKFFGTCMFPF